MVSILISQLIGQMRGTSHESQTTWVGCMWDIDQERVNQINIITLGNNTPIRKGEPRPMVAYSSKKIPQAPRSSQSSKSNSSGTLIGGPIHDPSFSWKVKNLTFPRGFVRIFATCSSVPMWWSLLVPRCTISRMKCYMISICLKQSWNTGFSESQIPLWLITVVSSTCPNNSLKSFLNQTTSQQGILAAMYSASALLKATNFYFLLIQDSEAEPSEKQHINVLLRSSTFPA